MVGNSQEQGTFEARASTQSVRMAVYPTLETVYSAYCPEYCTLIPGSAVCSVSLPDFLFN